ncbi:VOC family protein [Nocardiopsis sp. RSe5-2]|uniref:VOC family protein n=1 Tax=Nocardiopsis endophytica TaxID=3018445 RepID=A0ABT4U4G6_9ACTN|nr:VOC family protein [Nocardiopsis endophytica]MDA2811838.1 VOC family protein [Nocardiopsis endophytica]
MAENRKVFINLPVSDLDRAKTFYTDLGFTINPQFSDENAACVVVSDEIYVMVLLPEFFGQFTDKPVADTEKSREVIVALSAESGMEVDTLTERARTAGGTVTREPTADGPMYGSAFLDPDGHLWELMYMDMSQMG